MILHSNQYLSNKSVAASLNNSFSNMKSYGSSRNMRGGSKSTYSIWDIKEPRLGGRSRIKKVENGIYKP